MEITDEDTFHDYRRNVQSKQHFIECLKYLKRDFEQGHSEWENATLDCYLEAAAAYANDVPGYYKNFKIEINPDKPSWQVMIDILSGARVYE